MMTDPIADLLIQIKNGYMARKNKIVVSHSKAKEALAALLSNVGYLGKVEINRKDKGKPAIAIELVYRDSKPKVNQIINVSTPGRRVYVNRRNIPRVLGGLGITVISTPSGLMIDSQAAKLGLGGEVICKIW